MPKSEVIVFICLYAYCATVAAYGAYVEFPDVGWVKSWPSVCIKSATVLITILGPASFLSFILGCFLFGLLEVAKEAGKGLVTLARWARYMLQEYVMQRALTE